MAFHDVKRLNKGMGDIMQTANLETTADLWQKKHELMKEYLSLSEQQAQSVSREDYDLLLRLIEQKQTIIDAVDRLTMQLQNQTAQDLEQLQTIKDKTRAICLQASAWDEKNMQLLKKHQEQVLSELVNINKSRKTHAQYRGANVKMEGVFLDIKQ